MERSRSKRHRSPRLPTRKNLTGHAVISHDNIGMGQGQGTAGCAFPIAHSGDIITGPLATRSNSCSHLQDTPMVSFAAGRVSRRALLAGFAILFVFAWFFMARPPATLAQEEQPAPKKEDVSPPAAEA